MLSNTITLDDFITLVDSSGWCHVTTIDNSPRPVTIPVKRLDENNMSILQEKKTRYHGYSTVTSNLGDLQIQFSEHWDFEYLNADSLVIHDELYDDEDGLNIDYWRFYGFRVVDDSGTTINPRFLSKHLASGFSHVDYTDLVEKIECPAE